MWKNREQDQIWFREWVQTGVMAHEVILGRVLGPHGLPQCPMRAWRVGQEDRRAGLPRWYSLGMTLLEAQKRS